MGLGPETRVTFLAVAQEDIEWGIAATQVECIVRTADFRGAPPIDLGERLGLPRGGAAAERVLVVCSGEDRRVALSAPGRMRFRTQLPSDVLPLPALAFRSAEARRILVGLVMSDDGPPLFIVEAGALLPPSPSDPTNQRSGDLAW